MTMADNFGAKPYDYADYYTPIRGQNEADKLKGNEVAPGQDMVSKLRSLFGMFGVGQTPVNLSNPNAGVGEKLRGGLALAPALQPTATQADVRKSDNAMANPAMPNFGAVPAPTQFAPVATGASQSQVRASDNIIAANTPAPVVDGAWAPPHAASPGIGAQLVAGPATTSVSSSRDANGNLVLTNAPPGPAGPAGPGAAPQGYQARAGSLASFFGASMRMKQAATTDAAARATALKLPETMKSAAEATILSERMKLAAAEPDPARKAAILAGHVMSEPKLQAPPNMQPMPGDKDQSGVVFDPAKGAFRKVPITQAATTANIDAALAGSMKGKTRAQVIQAYKDKGYDVSGVK